MPYNIRKMQVLLSFAERNISYFAKIVFDGRKRIRLKPQQGKVTSHLKASEPIQKGVTQRQHIVLCR